MLSRRKFINVTLAAGAALATQGTKTVMAQSKRMIVDAQARYVLGEDNRNFLRTAIGSRVTAGTSHGVTTCRGPTRARSG